MFSYTGKDLQLFLLMKIVDFFRKHPISQAAWFGIFVAIATAALIYGTPFGRSGVDWYYEKLYGLFRPETFLESAIWIPLFIVVSLVLTPVLLKLFNAISQWMDTEKG